MANVKTVELPNIGDFSSVEIIEVHVKPGDNVTEHQAVFTLETDKAAMEVPASVDGKVHSLHVKVGSKVSQGDPIVDIEVAHTEDADTEKPQAKLSNAEEEVLYDVRVPDIGDYAEVEVIEMHVTEGDNLKKDQALFTIETDKAAMEVPTPVAGELNALHVKVGDKISKGDVVATIITKLEEDAPVATPTAPHPQAVSTVPPVAVVTHTVPEVLFGPNVHAGPAVRRLAREIGVDLNQVKGTGSRERITKDDVKAYARENGSGGLPKVPTVDFKKFGKTENIALTRVQKISGPRLAASWLNVPHVTQHDEVNISLMESVRQSLKAEAKSQGFSLTPLAFLVRASVAVLQQFPSFNASLSGSGEELVLKRYYHIGFAAETPNGLVVPVIKEVDRMSLFDIAKALGDLSLKAREGKLPGTDMQGGSFTISSLGGIGGTAFTPIVNAPEVAILGVSRSFQKPMYDSGEWVPQLTLPLSLSYDHRVIDGATAVRFTRAYDEVLNDLPYLVDGLDDRLIKDLVRS